MRKWVPSSVAQIIKYYAKTSANLFRPDKEALRMGAKRLAST